MGGTSAEREVSLNSGEAVYQALINAGVDAIKVDVDRTLAEKIKGMEIDLAFNIVHGRGGEDGALQGFLQWHNIPYTGSGVKASAITMDKFLCKQIWQDAGLPVAKSVLINNQQDLKQIAEQWDFPLVIKPTSEGSSFGVSIVHKKADLQTAWENARQYGAVMAEAFIAGEEYTLAIVGGKTLPMIKLKPAREFYDYKAKYLRDDTQYICPCGLPPEVENQIARQCKQAFDLTGCEGWGRVDVIFDGKQAYLIEINTVPGMTSHSLVPMAAKAAGMSFEKLVLTILDLVNREKNKINEDVSG